MANIDEKGQSDVGVRGRFLSFEGIDGVGKSTQAHRLVERLQSDGYSVLHTREPGGTAIGAKIRRLLLDPNRDTMGCRTEVLLYAADRAQHVHEVILPALNRGSIVVCDRYVDSSLAYQGFGLELGAESIQTINDWGTAHLVPELTLLLDAEPETTLVRVGGDRIETRTLEYYRKVREGFLTIASEAPARVVVVNAMLSSDRVADDVWRIVETWLSR